ncbi:MAG TPA: EVE domain-containing protein [Candidatus Paceibacterota bacterium]
MQYWLIKSEPSCYSIDDLKRDKVTSWTDVRNYQARNFLQAMKKGDGLLYYHSSCDAVGVVGLATVVKEAYPDPTQYDQKSEGYDEKATAEKPRWYTVDVRFMEKFKQPVSLNDIKNDTKLTGIEVAKQGSRLSVQQVSEVHFNRIVSLAQTRSQ